MRCRASVMLVVALCAVAAAPACGDGDTCDGLGAAILEAGVAGGDAATFAALKAGDELTIQLAAMAPPTVSVALRVRGVDTSDGPRTEASLWLGDSPIGGLLDPPTWTATGDGAVASSATLVIDAEVMAVEGRTVELRAAVTDGCDRRTAASLDVKLVR